jgi:hypothetical protein
MKAAKMSRTDELVLIIALAFDMAAPIVLLLLLRRWTGQWWVAFMGTVIVIPIGSFLLTGAAAWLVTYCRLVIRGDIFIPDEIGQTLPEYLATTFGVCGAYGTMFACLGFGLSLPVLALWWIVHRRSLDRLAKLT